MKEFILKIWKWIKDMLKKTPFDNILFEKGMMEVEKYLLSLPIEENIGKIYDEIVKALFEKFGHIVCVERVLNKALAAVNEKLGDNQEFIKLAYDKKVKQITQALIEWYNKNL